jgi:hypothetical protein
VLSVPVNHLPKFLKDKVICPLDQTNPVSFSALLMASSILSEMQLKREGSGLDAQGEYK